MLDVAQPTLSRQVRLLEQELGQHLLYRNGRGVEPTEAGLRFVEHARALLALAERAREDLRSLRETPAGKVSVGLPPRIARVLTPPLVQAFRREFPGASIAVAEGLSAQVREWLLAGRVDLALLYDPAPHLSWPASRCSAKTWCWPPPRRSARAARTRRGQDLGAYPLVLPSPPNAIRTLVDSVCRAQGVRLQVAAEVDAVQTIVELAAQGDACAILPRSAARDRRPSTRWRWPISSPPHRQQPGAGDRPPPSLDAAGLGHRQTDTRAGTARPVRPRQKR